MLINKIIELPLWRFQALYHAWSCQKLIDEKKNEIRLSPITKAPVPTENSTIYWQQPHLKLHTFTLEIEIKTCRLSCDKAVYRAPTDSTRSYGKRKVPYFHFRLLTVILSAGNLSRNRNKLKPILWRIATVK